MAVEFLMPKLGLTMEEGTIVAWLVSDGVEVVEGAEVVEIETDKVVSVVEASGSGVLRALGQVGSTYACGERIGWFLEPGESPPVGDDQPTGSTSGSAGDQRQPAPDPVEAAPTEGGRLLASPNARRLAAERGVDLAGVIGSGPEGRIVSQDLPTAGSIRGAPAPGQEASSAARQLAALVGVDLELVRAGGPESRITRADVARHLRERLDSTYSPETTPSPLLQAPSSTMPMTGMRGTIADRMLASLQEMAQLTLTMDVGMDAVVRHRESLDGDTRPGYTDYVVAAAAGALGEHRVVNSQIHDGQLALLPDIHVGVAVAVDGGLLVPVVKEADSLSLDAISAETTRLAAAARTGSLSHDEIEGATFSVTALGMYGVDAFTPVINPPNTAILGVGRLRDGVRWQDGVAVPTCALTLSLTWDHRAFDGAPAAEFTAAVRDRLERWGSSP